jgi:hypothetical protein
MDAPQADISPDEYVLRRVHKNHYTAGLPVPVQKAAARPTEADTDGLSVYLERSYHNNPSGILAQVDEAKRGSYYVARVRVAELVALGLHVRLAEGPEHLPGHCVIPELTREAYDNDQTGRVTDHVLAIAKLLGQDIIYSPPVS